MNANIYLLFWEGLLRDKLPSSSERVYLVLRGAINAHKIGGMSTFLFGGTNLSLKADFRVGREKAGPLLKR